MFPPIEDQFTELTALQYRLVEGETAINARIVERQMQTYFANAQTKVMAAIERRLAHWGTTGVKSAILKLPPQNRCYHSCSGYYAQSNRMMRMGCRLGNVLGVPEGSTGYMIEGGSAEDQVRYLTMLQRALVKGENTCNTKIVERMIEEHFVDMEFALLNDIESRLSYWGTTCLSERIAALPVLYRNNRMGKLLTPPELMANMIHRVKCVLEPEKFTMPTLTTQDFIFSL